MTRTRRLLRRSLRAGAIIGLVIGGPVSTTAMAQTPTPWGRLQFLLGTWESKGESQLGAGVGSTSFALDLQGRIIVRRSFAEYTPPRPRHDDLLVLYRDGADSASRAVYFDSEGHVIRYAVSTPGENTLVLQSDGSDAETRYRLTYTRKGSALDGVFEIGAPHAPYKTYLSWSSILR